MVVMSKLIHVLVWMGKTWICLFFPSTAFALGGGKHNQAWFVGEAQKI